MNVFLLADIVILAFLILVLVLFLSVRGRENEKNQLRINAILFGLFFLMVYYLMSLLSYLLAYYNYSTSAIVYSSNLVVLPIAAIFFFVSVILPSE
ncbi:MAG: hypothetical protein QXR60_03225 [Candidatus Nanoarchaeia archaeon]